MLSRESSTPFRTPCKGRSLFFTEPYFRRVEQPGRVGRQCGKEALERTPPPAVSPSRPRWSSCSSRDCRRTRRSTRRPGWSGSWRSHGASCRDGGRLREAELSLQAARAREELSARSYRALAERARQELAACPRCRKPVRGSDLLVSGHCPHCGKAFSSLLTPVARAGGLEPGEYLALLGALGAVVGFALAGTAENPG